MKRLHLSPEFSLPLDAVTETAAILAVKRAGKSNAGVVMAEEMFDAEVPWTAIDPKGDWWGVLASGDGKSKGLPVAVFGGEHGHMPLEPTAGRLIARLVATKRLTCVLDVSTMSKADMRRFLTDFAEELYKLNRDPMHLFCEEADEYIPQRFTGEAARMVGAYENLVKRGGFRGIGVTLITQRSASLNKDVLTQAGTLFAMRTPSPQDRKQVKAWIEENTGSEEVLKELRRLKSGEAWVFSTLREPELQKIHFRRRRTFDSGATPKVGEKVKPPATLADVDLKAIAAEMTETIERAKAEDPKELRKQVAELRAELAKLKAAKPAPAPKVERREVPVLKDGQLSRLEKSAEVLRELADHITRALSEVARAKLPSGTTPDRPRYIAVAHQVVHAQPARTPRAVPPAGDVQLGRGQRAVLAAIAQHPGGVTREQLTVLTGYKRSSRDTYLQQLRAAGALEDGTVITATDQGLTILGPDFERLPTGAALLEHWLQKLPAGERAVLEVVVKDYPGQVDREAISEITGYQRSSRDTYLQKLRARQLITEPARGQVRASDQLFDAGAEVANG